MSVQIGSRKHKPEDIDPQGAGSGLDSDKVDGKHASELIGGSESCPYDIDDNGIIDNSEKLEGKTLAEVQDHPPKEHVHLNVDADMVDGKHANELEDCGISSPPPNKSITKIGFWEDVNHDVRYIKYYDGAELLFTLTFDNAGEATQETWNIIRT